MKIDLLTREDIRDVIREELEALTRSMQPVTTKRMNLEEAADYVGLPVPTFRLHQHRIGGVKIGKRWTFTTVELDRFLEANKHKTKSEIREAL